MPRHSATAASDTASLSQSISQSISPSKSASLAASPAVPADFGARVVQWQRTHGRHDLPWQNTRDPYRIWLSEIMLQQTQVAAVIDYYQRFLSRLPTVADLAAASSDDVMALWAGLGYYSRARNLHRCAKLVVEQHGGRFPVDPAVLVTLPGIGRSTAAAIAAFGAGVRSPILDGNVKRVFARCFGVHGYPGERAVENRMWTMAEAALPAPAPTQADDMVAYTQGLMDLGATVCTRGKPACLADAGRCPLSDICVARREGLTAVLPVPKPRAAVPERSTVMLMLRHGGEVLLGLRPDSGVWGGLWSLPEIEAPAVPFDPEQAELAALDHARVFGTPRKAALVAELTHVFTHFRLLIRAIRVDMSALALHEPQGHARDAQSDGWRWLGLHELDALGMPAPVRKLLESQRGGLFG